MLSIDEKLKATDLADKMLNILTADFEGKMTGNCLEFSSLVIATVTAALVFSTLNKHTLEHKKEIIDFIASMSLNILEEIGGVMNNANR